MLAFLFLFQVVERIVLMECVIIQPFFHRLFAIACALGKDFLGGMLVLSGAGPVDHWSSWPG